MVLNPSPRSPKERLHPTPGDPARGQPHARPAAVAHRAQAALDDAKAFVFSASPVGMAVLRPDGVVVDANEALVRILDRPRHEIVGHHLVDLAQPEHREASRRWLERCGAGTADPIHVETWIRPGSDSSAWIEVDGGPVVDESGRVTSLVIAIQDATHSWMLHGALASAQVDLAKLVTNAPIAMCRLDAEDRVVMWNPAAEAMFGWTACEVIGRPLPFASESSSAVEGYRALRARAVAGEHLIGTQVACQTKDETPLQVRVWTSTMESTDGGPPEVVGFMVDITDEDRARRELRASEHRWRTLVQNVSDTVTVIDATGTIRSTTGQLKPVLGYPSGVWDGRAFGDILHPDDVDKLQPVIDRVLAAPGAEVTTDARVRHSDGSWVDLHVTAVNLLDDPAVGGVVLTTRNVTDRKRAEALVHSQAEILELIARGSPLDHVLEAIAVMVEDHDPSATAAVLLLEGGRLRPRARPGGGPSRELWAAFADIEVTPDFQKAYSQDHGVPVVITDVAHTNPGHPVNRRLVADGFTSLWWAPVVAHGATHPVGVVMAFHPEAHEPSADARQAAEVACSLVAIALDRHANVTELAHRELHDDLTGLPNRTLLVDRLQTALDRATRLGEEVAVLYVDLDRFKMVNDSLGHTVGDAVLTAMADRLRAVTRPGDTIARVGADEFVILCDRSGSLSTTLSVADRLTEAMKEPFASGASEVFLTVSLGLALNTPGNDGPAMLRNADAAMFRAKQRGRDRLEMYDPAMQASAHDRLALGSDLRRAISRHELRVVYQPIVALDTGRMVGAEALLRWRHPTRGDVPPTVFIPIAEETGTIVEIGAWVLDTALAELAPVARSAGTDFTLSVNLSPRQLDDSSLVARVTAALRHNGWTPEQLCLELTETALTEDLDTALRALVRLRATGAQIAVDDFGTGYSSLTHLQRLPIDTIKIDRSFVQSLGESGGTDRSTIATAVLGIAHAMGLGAVAEGVETRAQLNALRELGCPLGQGYLFSVPVPVDALVALALPPA